jgi:hypothetical protein
MQLREAFDGLRDPAVNGAWGFGVGWLEVVNYSRHAV